MDQRPRVVHFIFQKNQAPNNASPRINIQAHNYNNKTSTQGLYTPERKIMELEYRIEKRISIAFTHCLRYRTVVCMFLLYLRPSCHRNKNIRGNIFGYPGTRKICGYPGTRNICGYPGTRSSPGYPVVNIAIPGG